MQTSGVFPQLSDGRSKRRGKPTARPRSKSREVMEDGQGWTKRQPRPVNAPKTLAGRRAASHKKAESC